MGEALFDSPIGPLYVVASSEGIERLELVRHASSLLDEPASAGTDAGEEAQQILEDTRRQLDEYFAGERRDFELPLILDGSDFQKRVWQAICRIPYGETLSYGDLAMDAGAPGAFRAAGSACGVNKIAILIPCHRVVGANRAIGGYGGGLEIKTALLKLEGSLSTLRGGQGALAFA